VKSSLRMDFSFSIVDRCDSIDHSTAHRASSEKTTVCDTGRVSELLMGLMTHL
jgi:hypothetical protein